MLIYIIGFILNLPFSIIGLFVVLISVPKFKLGFKSHALILYVRSFWWAREYMKGTRAIAIGNVVILGPNLENGDLEHELVHIEQWAREPIIHPFLYAKELILHGYKGNKYEAEAYAKAGNIYRGK
jgi:hypothetical protein